MSNSPIWRPYTQEATARKSTEVVRASGAYLYTRDGAKIFDGISSWWLITHGHCQPEIVEAIARQARKLDQITFANFSHEPADELASLLLEVTPPSLSKVFFSDNGSTAVEVALKMALQANAQSGHPEKNKFLTFDFSYHGDTVGAMSVSGVSPFNQPYNGVLFQVLRATQPTSSCASVDEFLKGFRELFTRSHQNLAGVIIEPLIQGAGGMIMWPIEAVREIVQLCREHSVYVIFDEVMTGFGRTGRMFAMDHLQVTPDILCLSKGLTGGSLPLAVTLASEEVFSKFHSKDKLKMLFHGHSFTGNPISCAAAVASLKLMRQPALKKAWVEIEATHRECLRSLKQQLPLSDARVCGTVAAIEVQMQDSGYVASFVDAFMAACLERGLFVRPLGHVLYLMPTYGSSVEEVRWAWQVIREVTELVLQKH